MRTIANEDKILVLELGCGSLKAGIYQLKGLPDQCQVQLLGIKNVMTGGINPDGEINDFEEFSTRLKTLISAFKDAKDVVLTYVLLNSPLIKVKGVEYEISISKDREFENVSIEHLSELLKEVHEHYSDEEFYAFHTYPLFYYKDDIEVASVIGLKARKIRIKGISFTAPAEYLVNLRDTIRKLVGQHDIVLRYSPLTGVVGLAYYLKLQSGLKERKRLYSGSFIAMDIGESTVDVMVWHEGMPVFLYSFPTGSRILTDEIVRRFHFSSRVARGIKHKVASAMPGLIYEEQDIYVDEDGEKFNYSPRAISELIAQYLLWVNRSVRNGLIKRKIIPVEVKNGKVIPLIKFERLFYGGGSTFNIKGFEGITRRIWDGMIGKVERFPVESMYRKMRLTKRLHQEDEILLINKFPLISFGFYLSYACKNLNLAEFKPVKNRVFDGLSRTASKFKKLFGRIKGQGG